MNKIAYNIDLKVGDVVLGGKFKNIREIVKNFGTNEIGQPTLNGKSLLAFRIEKTLPNSKKSSMTLAGELDKIKQAAFADELGNVKDWSIIRKGKKVPLTKEIAKEEKRFKQHLLKKESGMNQAIEQIKQASFRDEMEKIGKKTHPVSEAQRKWAFAAEERGELPSGKAMAWSRRKENKNLPEKTASVASIRQTAFEDELDKLAASGKKMPDALKKYWEKKRNPAAAEAKPK
jgi:hypothetical protein